MNNPVNDPLNKRLADDEVETGPTQPNVNNSGKKTKVLITFICAILFIAVVFSIRALSNKSSTLLQTSTPAEVKSTEATVEITADGFVPATIRVDKGTEITWVNKDKSSHQVASDPHPAHDGLPGLDSQTPLAKNESYAFKFETEGTFTYHDHLDPLKFKGNIIVE